jgi:hypothetical protein
MFGIRVISGHWAVSPETETFSDGKPDALHTCKNNMLSHRLAEPFPDTWLCTHRGVGRVKLNSDQHASYGFSRM